MRIIFLFLLLFPVFFSAHAGEIEFSGRAVILKDDVRAAQKNSLNNALTGGIRRYLQLNVPERKADITADYYMFIDEYQIIDRQLVNNTVVTKVRIIFNDMILEDVATHVTRQVNTAVFIVSGLPDYVNEADIRRLVSAVFNEKQFSTKDQISFEQELIDRNSKVDIQTAFQSVSSQYLFQIKILLLSYQAGESCTVQSDISYISLNKLSTSIPVMMSKMTFYEEEPAECIIAGVGYLLENALEHVREKQIPSPGKSAELLSYQLSFNGIVDMKQVNDIIDSLQIRRFINGSELEEFFGNTAVYGVDSYFTSEQLAEKLSQLVLPEGTEIIWDEGVTVRLVSQ